jgi:hypothetical protein
MLEGASGMSDIGVIDKAWLTMERAMPEGYTLVQLGWLHGAWRAKAKPVVTRGFILHRHATGMNAKQNHGGVIEGDGVTPAEALFALADALDSFRQNTSTPRKHSALQAVIDAVFGVAA